MRRVLLAMAIALQIAAVAGAYCLDHFTRAKLGMNRWVMSYVHHLEDTYPMQAFIWLLCVTFAVVLIAILVWLIGKKRKTVPCVLSFALLCAFVGSFIVCAVVNSSEAMHAYYFVLALLACACAVQIAETTAIFLSKR